ncbi:hypothetical protein PPL_07433 [Heterostelium album PN500]|uniref:Uncharacterized protein n=1 Tax=Heterostelium pallidum (strain ATCC 26659 / Pp 5 / PN500) TaxID=670386 RepID=D3BFY2_HETP5|nr:hypothetical protein PPL_07433 [Heterostelium album PN500]EFA79742.1 hypothetical protein PPL_07433 [Heterostelium album PN500]|eukprot:XP_020431863.1 hypothetical protein PPL_07433 [Heterostelium album PN500]
MNLVIVDNNNNNNNNMCSRLDNSITPHREYFDSGDFEQLHIMEEGGPDLVFVMFKAHRNNRTHRLIQFSSWYVRIRNDVETTLNVKKVRKSVEIESLVSS